MLVTKEGLDDDMGEFSYTTRVIKVRPELHDAQARQTLAHEWAHSIFWDTGLHNVLPHDLEEQICDAIATALVAANLL